MFIAVVARARALRPVLLASFVLFPAAAVAQSGNDAAASSVPAATFAGAPVASSPTGPSAFVNARERATPTSAVARGPVTLAPAALSRRPAGDSTAPAPLMRRQDSNRANTALMIVGAAAILVGAIVEDDDASTVLIVGGAGIGLLGLYRFLN